MAFELGTALDELDALKRTVVQSNRPSKDTGDDDQNVLPSFMRVMEAEQSLHENFVYDDNEQQLSSNLQRNLNAILPILTGGKHRRLDDSSELDPENENSIPQESSIAANVSF